MNLVTRPGSALVGNRMNYNIKFICAPGEVHHIR